MVSKQFELASLEVEKVNKALSNDDKLLLYAYFKIANGNDFSAASKPGMFDMVGKAKYNAWKNEVDDGVDAAAAQKKYIETVEKCKTEYGFDATRKTQADGKAIDSKKLSRFDELVKELGKTN